MDRQAERNREWGKWCWLSLKLMRYSVCQWSCWRNVIWTLYVYEGSIASYSVLLSRLVFTKSVTVSVTVLKMGVVLHQAWSKSQWTVLLVILLSEELLEARWQFCLSARQCTGASLFNKVQCSSAKLSTSFVLNYGPITVQSLTPLTTRFRESYSSVSISWKQQDWIN